MRSISSSGSASPLAPSAAPRAQPQPASAQPGQPSPSQKPTLAAPKLQSHQPYMLGNAFDNYVSPTGT